MRTYKQNDVREHNYYYAGASSKRKKHGQGKPGTTRQQDIRARLSRIRFEEKDFVLYGYIDIQYVHKSRLEALEHEVKATLTEMGIKNTGNDHFEFEMDKRFTPQENNMIFCACCLKLAVDYCKAHNLKYTVTWLG